MTSILVHVWFVVMVAAMVATLITALRILGCFEAHTNQSAEENARSADDPWRVKRLVESFRDATKKPWPVLDKDGKPVLDKADKPEQRYSEMDAEDALRLILDHRKRTVTLLIGFAALIAVLTTAAIVSLADKRETESAAGEVHAEMWTVMRAEDKNPKPVAAGREPGKPNPTPAPGSPGTATPAKGK